MPEQPPCAGVFCNGTNIVAALALAAVVAFLIGFVLFRLLPVNAARKREGLAPLPWREIAGSRMRARDLSSASGDLLEVERELKRQMEWEKEQASHELIRTGQHVTRQYCAPHQRWCFHPFEQGHPSGGFDNPTVPDDWPPDLTKLLKK